MAHSPRHRFLSLSFAALAGTALVVAAATVTVAACGNSDDDSSAAKDGSASETDGSTTGQPGSDGGTSNSDAGPTALSFKPSNIDLSGVDLGTVGDADITSSCVFTFTGAADGATSCDPASFTFAYLKQGDGSSVGVFIARSIHVEAGVSITSGVGTVDPIVLVSLGTFVVDGVIDMSADDEPGGISAGGAIFSGSNFDSMGLGMGGGGAGSPTNAGGGGSYCGIGGKGAAFEDAGTSAAGGAVYGSATLVPLVGGSTGGVGGVSQYGQESEPGSGGGALQLVAGTSITINDGGAVGAGGGPGSQAYDNVTQAAGGGSGGAVLLEAPVVTVIGTIAVNGGGGGGGGGQVGNGASASPVFAPGGNDYTGGNGNGTLPGDAGIGVPATTNGSDGVPQDNGNDPGAGGGGGGRIRINTTSGKATITGVLSPDITDTACVTQGTLGH
jgi:hypothetical protein